MAYRSRHVAVSLVAGCLATAVAAHSPMLSEQADDLAQLVTKSNLVVMGEVAAVQYQNARSAEGTIVPHTIVTFRVAKAYRGRVPGDTLVLRFIGGSDGMGRFLEVQGVPKFQPGDRDMLFVAGNGEQGCALVNCEYGRYRLLGERVFDTHGAPVRAIVKNGAIARGEPPKELLSFSYPTPSFDALMKNPEVQAQLRQTGLSVDAARQRYAEGAPKRMEVTTPYSAAGAKDDGKDDAGAVRPGTDQLQLADGPIALDTFTAKIGELIARTTRPAEPFRNADPTASIVLPKLVLATPAPPRRQPVRPLRPATAAEAAEVRALAAQDFNPVIKR